MASGEYKINWRSKLDVSLFIMGVFMGDGMIFIVRLITRRGVRDIRWCCIVRWYTVAGARFGWSRTKLYEDIGCSFRPVLFIVVVVLMVF